MASTYGHNFGFRISDETRRWSAGRWRTPAAPAAALRIGTAVKQDTASPDDLAQCAEDDALVPGTAGILLQELQWDRSRYEGQFPDSFELGVARQGRLSVVTGGAGVKVWLKNTAAQNPRADGRVIPVVDIFDVTNDGAGNPVTWQPGVTQMGWSGTQWVAVDGVTVTEPWATVNEIDTSREYLEMTLLA